MDPQKLIWIDTQGSLTHIATIIQIRRCEWTQDKKMTRSKSPIKNSKLFYMYAALLFVDSRDAQNLIWIDTQGSLTLIVEIFKLGGVGGPRVTKWPRERGWGRGLGRKMGQGWRGNGVGWGLALRGARAWVMGGILMSPRNILRGILW